MILSIAKYRQLPDQRRSLTRASRRKILLHDPAERNDAHAHIPHRPRIQGHFGGQDLSDPPQTTTRFQMTEGSLGAEKVKP
jgi:hypothetical protein